MVAKWLWMLALTFATSAAAAAPQALRGRVVLAAPVALPADAVLQVVLADVALADAASVTLAQQAQRLRGRAQIPFHLRYDSARIGPAGRYALSARVTHRGRLLMVTTQHVPAFDGPEPVLRPDYVAASAPTPDRPVPAAFPAGPWQRIGGGSAAARGDAVNGDGGPTAPTPTLQIGPDGRVSGTGGCNRITGQAVVQGDAITFGPLATTRMACPPAVMAGEQKFLAALAQVRHWLVDGAGRLTLHDAQRRPLLTFTRGG